MTLFLFVISDIENYTYKWYNIKYIKNINWFIIFFMIQIMNISYHVLSYLHFGIRTPIKSPNTLYIISHFFTYFCISIISKPYFSITHIEIFYYKLWNAKILRKNSKVFNSKIEDFFGFIAMEGIQNMSFLFLGKSITPLDIQK